MSIANGDPSQENHKRSLRELLFWFLLIPVVFGSLLCCGQLAIILQRGSGLGLVSPLSQLSADYREWTEKYLVAPVNAAALIEDIKKEAALSGTQVALVPGDGQIAPTAKIWIQPTTTPQVVAELPTATLTPPEPVKPSLTPSATKSPTTVTSPTKTPTAQPTLTSTPTHTRTYVWIPPTVTAQVQEPPQPSRTPTVTPTRTATVPSPTPTATRTITLTPTNTATPTSTFTVTSTPTQTFTPTDTATITMTPTETPTSTITPTPTPTATIAPVHPVAENGGNSDKYDATSCVAYFGYKNDNSVSVAIPVDTNQGNQVVGNGMTVVNQTTVFDPGRQYGTFWVIWTSPNPITWWLQGKPVTANWCNP